MFFNVAYSFRLALGFAIPAILPDVQVTDFFGFGYLLSTLLAVKAHQQGVPLRTARVTVQASLVGVVAGSVFGFAKTFLPISWDWNTDVDNVTPSECLTEQAGLPLEDCIQRQERVLYQTRAPNSYVVPDYASHQRFEVGVRNLAEYARTGSDDKLKAAYSHLDAPGFQLDKINGQYLLVHEKSPANGWGMFVINLQNPDGLMIQVPAPLDEWAAIESGLALFRDLDAGSLAIAGSARGTNDDGSSDVLLTSRSMLAVFQRIAGRGKTLQVRGLTRHQLLQHSNAASENAERPNLASTLWVKGALPPELQLGELSSLIDDLAIQWRPLPVANRLRDIAWSGFAELTLTRADRGQLVNTLSEPRLKFD